MVDLPAELWLRIADLVGYPEILKCFTVHRAFLQYALDTKYRETGFDHAKVVDIFKEAERLKRPEIASRVRVLKLRPHVVAEALKGSQSLSPFPSPLSISRPRSRIKSFFSSVLRRRSHYLDSATNKSESGMEGPAERLQKLKDALSLLAGLDELRLYWNSLFHPLSDLDKQAASLFHSINPTLRILVLDIQFYPSVIPFLAPLSQSRLECLTISTGRDLKGNLAAEECLALATFANSFVESLKSFSLVILGHLDASSLFDKLIHFPRLRHVVLGVTLLRGHLTSPASLRNFLDRHPNLSSLRLKGRYCCQEFEDENVTNHYYEECFKGLQFPHLKEVSLGLPMLQGLRSDDVARQRALSFVKSLWTSVTGFTLEGSPLTTAETVELIRLLPASQLESLSLHISYFLPSLLRTLVVQCRQLRHLKLYVDSFSLHDRVIWDHEDLPPFQQEIEELIKESNLESYFRTWPLEKFEIITWRSRVDIDSGAAITEIIAKQVPSLRIA